MSDFIMLKNVRCSFPHLFSAPVINGTEGKCGATLLLDHDEHKAQIDGLQKLIASMAQTELKARVPEDKTCLRVDGAVKRPEYDGYAALSANSRSLPVVIGADGVSIVQSEKDSAIYAGCRVNAKVRLWAQNNQYGKRINCELIAIQFAGDDEPMADRVSPQQAMEGFGATATGASESWMQ